MFYTTSKRITPEIQMAPLIDMVFLLLIFFMVATIFPQDMGVEIEKPNAVTGKSLPNDSLIFGITKTGEYYFAGKAIGLDSAMEIIKQSVATQKNIPIVLRVDRLAITDHLINFMDKARLAGGHNIAIATEREDEL